MFGLGTKEIIIIAVVLVLLFGAKKVPDLARGIGEAIGYVRRAIRGEDEKENPNEERDVNK